MSEHHQYRLRPLQADDAELIMHWRNQPHVSAFMFSDERITDEQHRKWISNILQREDVDYQIVLLDDKPIGLANATRIDTDKRQCYWGFYLGEADAPRGSGTAMAHLMLDHLFSQYDIGTIVAEVFAFNTASLKLHEKLGFQPNPDITKSVNKNGKPEPVITLTLQHEHWQS